MTTSENRESFFKRLEPFHPPSTLRLIHLAYTLSKCGHRAQVRKEKNEQGEPVRYFEHVRRATIVLMDEVKCYDSEMIISTLLHDGIEDTRDLTPEMIEQFFGTDVVKIVKTLSKVPKEGYLDRFNTCKDWRPYVVKACDRLDNLRSLIHPDNPIEFQFKQVKETKEKYFSLFDKMITLTPIEYKDNVMSIRDSIRSITAHHEAILSRNII